MSRKKFISIKDFKKEIFQFEKRMKRLQGKNKLVDKYIHKVRYMLFWFRLIPCNKTILKNWYMPNIYDIYKLKEAKK